MVSWSYNHCHVHHGGCYKGVCRKVTNPYAVVPLLEASGYCGFWLYFIRKIWSVVTLCGRWRWRGAQKSFLRKTCKFTRSFHTFWIWMVFPEGRGFRNRCSQNPGIAKKGGGVWLMSRFVCWIYRRIPKTLLRHHPKIDHHQQVNIFPKSNHSFLKIVIYALCVVPLFDSSWYIWVLCGTFGYFGFFWVLLGTLWYFWVLFGNFWYFWYFSALLSTFGYF